MSGDYRSIVVKPGDFQFTIVNYESKSQRLDSNQQHQVHFEEKNYKNDENDEDDDDDDLKKKKKKENESFKGLIVEFNLPSSSYATVALREILLAV